MAMSLPVSPLTPISDIQSTPVNNASNHNINTNDGSPQSQDQMLLPPPPPPLSATTTNATMKRKPSRRANTAERRATHNAVERQRRETLNGRFLDLASLLPNLSQIRRPSKSSIVNSSIAYIHASRRHHRLASRELRLLKSENDHLRFEINEWRDRAGLMRIEEPVRSEGFSVVISGQMEVVQATLKPGSGLGRARRGAGEEGDEDEDDGEDGEGEDGMIGLGGYGGSYMDDVEEDVVLDGGPVEEFTSLPSSMPPPPSMHLHQHQQQQQQMALNAVIHHSHQAPPPLEDMDDPRIANLLLKNGTNNGFPQPSNFGFQQQQLPYNPHQQYQQQAFSSSYLPDKLWNDHQAQAQYPPTHHQMMQQQERALFNPPPLPPPESSLQQYHQPTLSVNTGLGMGGGGGGGVDLNNDVIGKSSMRGMAIKTKVANAKANARVKASTTRGHTHHSHSHSNGNGGSPSHSSHDDSPVSAGSMIIPVNGGSPSPSSSSSHSPHHFDGSSHRSGSRSGSESTSASSPSYELHSPGDYANGGGGGVPRCGGGGGMDHVVGFMNGMGLTASGMNMSSGGRGGGGGMNMAVGGMSGIPGMGYGGGHANSNAMMMMMM